MDKEKVLFYLIIDYFLYTHICVHHLQQLCVG